MERRTWRDEKFRREPAAMNGDRVVVVLDDSVRECDLTALAVRHGWRNRGRTGRGGDRPEEYIYCTADGATSLHYIRDHRTRATYILVNGPARAEVAGILGGSLGSPPRDPPVV